MNTAPLVYRMACSDTTQTNPAHVYTSTPMAQVLSCGIIHKSRRDLRSLPHQPLLVSVSHSAHCKGGSELATYTWGAQITDGAAYFRTAG